MHVAITLVITSHVSDRKASCQGPICNGCIKVRSDRFTIDLPPPWGLLGDPSSIPHALCHGAREGGRQHHLLGNYSKIEVIVICAAVSQFGASTRIKPDIGSGCFLCSCSEMPWSKAESANEVYDRGENAVCCGCLWCCSGPLAFKSFTATGSMDLWAYEKTLRLAEDFVE